MKLLILTNLFPNSKQPDRGVFNKQQFLALSRLCPLRVAAPLPWSPGWVRHPRWNAFADIPAREEIHGITVDHPRHVITPKVGRSFYGRWMFAGIKGCLEDIRREFPFNVILACWAYPDAYAGMLAARHFGVPLLVKVHGSDVNLYARFSGRRKRMVQAFRRSHRVIAVSSALKDEITALGVPSEQIRLVVNGVNTEIFKPVNRDDARREVGIEGEGRWIVFIGNLTPVKGVTHLITALRDLPPDVNLAICGDGELNHTLREQALSLHLQDRVHFIGRVAHTRIPLWMNAADVFCLPSLHEGCPNVVLEALACGTPVVASRVGGVPDLVTDPALGVLVPPADSPALAAGLQEVLGRGRGTDGRIALPPAARRSWDDSAAEIYAELCAAIGRVS